MGGGRGGRTSPTPPTPCEAASDVRGTVRSSCIPSRVHGMLHQVDHRHMQRSLSLPKALLPSAHRFSLSAAAAALAAAADLRASASATVSTAICQLALGWRTSPSRLAAAAAGLFAFNASSRSAWVSSSRVGSGASHARHAAN